MQDPRRAPRSSFEEDRGKAPPLFVRISAALAPGLLVLLLYSPVLGHGFLLYDDPLVVLDNPMVEEALAGDLVAAFRPRFINYRPLQYLSHALDHLVWDTNPLGHHASSLLLFAVACVLFQRWVLPLLGGRHLVASATAMLWAVHPVDVEVVAWIAARGWLLCGVFLLCSWLSHRHATQSAGWRSWTLEGSSWLAYVAALLSHPVAAPMFLVFLADEDALFAGKRLWAMGRLVPHLLAAGGFSIFTILWIDSASVHLLRAHPWTGPIPHLVPSILVDHFQRLLWPWPQATDPLLLPEDLVPVGVASLLLAALAATCIAALRRWPAWRRPMAAGGMLILSSLLPVSGLFDVWSFRADRYLFFPAAGLALMAGVGIAALSGWLRRLWIGAVLAAAVVYAATTAAWLPTWRDTVSLWSQTVSADPGNYPAWSALGNALRLEGRRDEARRALDRALELEPDHVEALFNLALMHLEEGRPGEAAELLRHAERVQPDDAELPYQLALAMEAMGRDGDAEIAYRRALERSPGWPPAATRLGDLLLRRGDLTGALELWEDASRQEGEEGPATRRLQRLAMLEAVSEAERDGKPAVLRICFGTPEGRLLCTGFLCHPAGRAAALRAVDGLPARQRRTELRAWRVLRSTGGCPCPAACDEILEALGQERAPTVP